MTLNLYLLFFIYKIEILFLFFQYLNNLYKILKNPTKLIKIN